MLGGSTERMCFQAKVDKELLKRFRTMQEEMGRTARSMIEDYFYNALEEHDRRKKREGGRQMWQM